MSLCKGCQELRTRAFGPKPTINDEPVTIHASFTALSECAETSCGLCQFFRHELCYRRQLCYRPQLGKSWKLNEKDLQDRDDAIIVEIDPSEAWMLYFGKNSILFLPHIQEKMENPRHIHEYRKYHANIKSSLELARKWLATCRTKHTACGLQTGDDESFLPTRLLDVGQPKQDSIRLVLSGNIQKPSSRGSYVTLSYCWGQAKDAACTTKENMGERLHEICISSLPQTIQDAVEITRAFGERYLWIDALCIIQVKEGKNEDWLRELPNMGKIYKHSLFTIAASSARESSVGCFHRREASYWPVQDYELVDEDSMQRIVLFAEIPSWADSVDFSVLNSRGWVLQERYLASRTLFWTDEGLFWECSQARLSECADFGLGGTDSETLRELAEKVKNYRIEEPYGGSWVRVLHEFSRRKFTVRTDRLPAIEGLMSEISRLTGAEHEAGVWKHNLAVELAWMVGPFVVDGDVSSDSQATRLPGIPSWSWGSVNKELIFKTWDHRKYRALPPNASIHAQEVRVRVRMGNLQLQKMEIVAGVSSLNWQRYYPHHCVFQPAGNRPAKNSHGIVDELAVFDTLADTLPAEGGTVKCIPWLEFPNTFGDEPLDYSVISAMMITPVDEEKNIYRRIGWVDLQGDRDIFSKEYQDITLV